MDDHRAAEFASMTRTLNTNPKPPEKLAHFVIRCRHFKETLAWYKLVLTAREVHTIEYLSFLTYDNEHHRIALANMPQAKETTQSHQGVDHIAFTLNTVEELLSLYKRLKAEDILPVWKIHHGGTLSLYYQDPEGIRCEFQIEVFDSVEAVEEFMRTEAFAENPIGVDFDPELLIQRFLAGESEESLLDQSRIQ